MRRCDMASMAACGLLAMLMAGGCATHGSSPKAIEPVSADSTQLPATQPRDLLDGGATIEGGGVTLRVNPDVGRVVFFGETGGENLLWLDGHAEVETLEHRKGRTWANWGGDKLWLAYQNMWPSLFGGGGPRWPPDAVIDGAAWTLLVDAPNAIVMESPPSPELAVVARRRFEITGEGEVLITNTVTRREPAPFPVMVWSVTQTPMPDLILLHADADAPAAVPPVTHFGNPHPDEGWRELTDGRVRQWLPPETQNRKVGTLGRGLVATFGDHAFFQTHPYDPLAAYPDASSVQVYRDPGRYTELELLSPQVQLRPGESLVHRVRWRLEPVAGRGPAGLAARLRTLVAEHPGPVESDKRSRRRFAD